MLWVTLPPCGVTHKWWDDYSRVTTPVSTISPAPRHRRPGPLSGPCWQCGGGPGRRFGTARSQGRLDPPSLLPQPGSTPDYGAKVTCQLLWIGSGQRCELEESSGDWTPAFRGLHWGLPVGRPPPVVGKPSAVVENPGPRAAQPQTAFKVTGIAFNEAFPDSGSRVRSSVRMFEFTPAFSAATAIRVPGTLWPQP